MLLLMWYNPFYHTSALSVHSVAYVQVSLSSRWLEKKTEDIPRGKKQNRNNRRGKGWSIFSEWPNLDFVKIPTWVWNREVTLSFWSKLPLFCGERHVVEELQTWKHHQPCRSSLNQPLSLRSQGQEQTVSFEKKSNLPLGYCSAWLRTEPW